MNLQELTEKAVHIRRQYEQKDAAEGKKIADRESLVMQFVSDVGDLSRYITKKERGDAIENFEEGVARELAECLTHILILADEYKIDLENAFIKESGRLESVELK